MDSLSPGLNLIWFSVVFLGALFFTGNAALILLKVNGPAFSLDLRVGLAMVVGLSLIPILLLWSTMAHIRWSPVGAWVYTGAAIAVNGWAAVQNRQTWRERRLGRDEWALVWLGGIFALTWLTRFWAVYGFLVAPGADSYHHTLIATLIAQAGQVPDSYLPYAPVESFTYHFGFHAITAFAHWLTGLPLTKLTLWVGQALNALTVPAVYFLAKWLTKQTRLALWAAFLVGLVAVFPAYLVNWSRFTQLAGLVVLIPAIGLALDWQDRRYLRVLPMLVGGVFLTHYRIFAMLGLLVGVIGLATVLEMAFSHEKRFRLQAGGRLALVVALGLAIVSPWVVKIVLQSTLFDLGNYLKDTADASPVLASYYSLERLGAAREFYSNYWLLLLGSIGLIVGLVRHRRVTLVLGGWMGVMFLWSNPYWLSIPGAGLLDTNSVVMSLFAPVCLFAAVGVSRLLPDAMETGAGPLQFARRNWAGLWVLLGLLIFATNQARAIANSDEVWVRGSDVEAMAWIERNTPAEAKFLINPYLFEWKEGVLAGTDAGYWIPLLTGRQSTILPILVSSERTDSTVWAGQLRVAKAVLSPGQNTAAVLQGAGVTYIFVGDKGGALPIDALSRVLCLSEEWRRHQTAIYQIDYQCQP